MHPEGVATDSAIQEMLFWQKHTMHMMYARVAQAIHSAGKNSHPTEYLMFFCLGKKEAIEDIPAQLAKPPRFSGMSLNSFCIKNKVPAICPMNALFPIYRVKGVKVSYARHHKPLLITSRS